MDAKEWVHEIATDFLQDIEYIKDYGAAEGMSTALDMMEIVTNLVSALTAPAQKKSMTCSVFMNLGGSHSSHWSPDPATEKRTIWGKGGVHETLEGYRDCSYNETPSVVNGFYQREVGYDTQWEGSDVENLKASLNFYFSASDQIFTSLGGAPVTVGVSGDIEVQSLQATFYGLKSAPVTLKANSTGTLLGVLDPSDIGPGTSVIISVGGIVYD